MSDIFQVLKEIFTPLLILVATLLSGWNIETERLADYLRSVNPPHSVSCEAPILYRIDRIDSGFGVSAEEFQAALLQAEKLWEEAIRRDLFEYASAGTLPVSLVFDDRQVETLALKDAFSSIQSDQDKYEAARAEYGRLEAALEDRKTTYEKKNSRLIQEREAWEADVRVYEKRAREYEEAVASANAAGGADEEQYAALEKERKKLEAMLDDINDTERDLAERHDALDADRKSINKRVQQLNTLAGIVNALAVKTNTQVERYNNLGRSRDEIEAGVYRVDEAGPSIEVYQFFDRDDLILVLAHELGHALGLQHASQPESLMYPTLGHQFPTLSTEDRALAEALCKK